MKVTLKDIAEKTGYSLSTISRALRESDKISESAKKEIIEVAEQIGYPLPGRHRADGTSQGTLNVLVIVTAEHVDLFYATFYDGFNIAAHDQDIQLFLLRVKRSKERLYEVMDQLGYRNYDGIVLFTPELKQNDYELLKDEIPENYPIVSNGLIENPVFDTITFDSYRGGHLVAQHFDGQNFREVGIVGGPFDKLEARYRYNGFCDYIEQSKEMKLVWNYEGDFTYAAGVRAFQDYHTATPKPRAVFVSNDTMCYGFMLTAQRQGYRVPEDVALVGYDDLPLSRQIYPAITSVHTDFKELGSTSLDILIDLIDNPRTYNGMLSLVPLRLKVRDSSMCSE